MEVKKLITLAISPQLKEKLDKEQKQKEEASKSFGDFLISITNRCFDKCINPSNIYLTKQEEVCIKDFFYKFNDAHQYALGKFKKINDFTELNKLERADDYGSYYGLLESLFKEPLEKKKTFNS